MERQHMNRESMSYVDNLFWILVGIVIEKSSTFLYKLIKKKSMDLQMH